MLQMSANVLQLFLEVLEQNYSIQQGGNGALSASQRCRRSQTDEEAMAHSPRECSGRAICRICEISQPIGDGTHSRLCVSAARPRKRPTKHTVGPPPMQNALARVEMAAASVAGVSERERPKPSPKCLQR